MKVNESDQGSPKTGSLSGFTRDILHNLSQSIFPQPSYLHLQKLPWVQEYPLGYGGPNSVGMCTGDPDIGLDWCTSFQSFTFQTHVLALATHRPQIWNVLFAAARHTGHTTDVASSTPLRCTGRGDTSGEAGFITTWKQLQCLTIALIHETREDSRVHKWPGLYTALSSPGSQMQGRC